MKNKFKEDLGEVMGNGVNKTFQTESHFDNKLILVIRNFDAEKSNQI